MTHVEELHKVLDPVVRDQLWESNCAGEVFLTRKPQLRIGHFQGDAAIAAFVVAAHNELVKK